MSALIKELDCLNQVGFRAAAGGSLGGRGSIPHQYAYELRLLGGARPLCSSVGRTSFPSKPLVTSTWLLEDLPSVP